MNNVIWITVQEASVILDCTRSNVHHLIRYGNIRRRGRASESKTRLVYVRHSDCVDYRASSAWRASKMRNVGSQRKGVREEEDQPIISKDVERLLKKWCGSADQKAYARRYDRANRPEK